MPIFSYRCSSCNYDFDSFCTSHTERSPILPCPRCGEEAKYIISVGKVDVSSECPQWLKGSAEMADPEGGPHCTEFIRDPTRQNYKNWLEKSGLRHMEPGERPQKPKVDTSNLRKEMKESHRKRMRIEL